MALFFFFNFLLLFTEGSTQCNVIPITAQADTICFVLSEKVFMTRGPCSLSRFNEKGIAEEKEMMIAARGKASSSIVPCTGDPMVMTFSNDKSILEF